MTATESTERGLGGGKDISVISVAESYKKQIWFSIIRKKGYNRFCEELNVSI
ncbi:MAG: hypothetical protein KAJ93_03770 [Methanosarcinales archaeon]|nr:hypothetical protein [Methanosarcinales archaeon]